MEKQNNQLVHKQMNLHLRESAHDVRIQFPNKQFTNSYVSLIGVFQWCEHTTLQILMW